MRPMHIPCNCAPLAQVVQSCTELGMMAHLGRSTDPQWMPPLIPGRQEAPQPHALLNLSDRASTSGGSNANGQVPSTGRVRLGFALNLSNRVFV